VLAEGHGWFLRRFVGLYLMKSLGITACWSTDFQLGLLGAALVVDERG
jgi:hypothetical protein